MGRRKIPERQKPLNLDMSPVGMTVMTATHTHEACHPCTQATLAFGCDLLQASSAILFWVDSAHFVQTIELAGTEADLLPEYFNNGFYTYDPLNIRKVLNGSNNVLMLEQERNHNSHDHNQIHDTFLQRHGIVDEINFLFRNENDAVALLSVMNRQIDLTPFPTDFQWEPLRRYMEFTLQQHPQMRARRIYRILKEKFHLTNKEVEVVFLLEKGASNWEISEIMHIGISTVKTHIVNILNKTGVGSRAAAAAYMRSL
ncbi:helix-turn-helix transcriptional regulator [Novacetimonas hansenii]|uniref:helix-turn-helix transcriptional regulator n=1 Tax=Novacetimonas hansenii TaxID=436 RepID=UPI00079A3B06|nr:helix-turn-helix transcriptional regulator [Novacetimonas hansenii]WEQ58748.1 helix-turn-helix transcriptional regulator [Novacetimonas hansenii]CUW48067.1 Response regulator protein VraR [Novacetimonas hansenii]